MKKKYLAIVCVACVGLFWACVEEEHPAEDVKLGKNDIVFVLKNVHETRSEKKTDPAINTYELKAPSIGKMLYLDETVSSIDRAFQPSHITRGTPAYTENVAALYGSFNGVAYKNTSEIIEDGAFTAEGDIWTRRFDGRDPWGDEEELFFFMRMPGEQSGVTGNYTYSTSDGTIQFKYTTPSFAKEQQDILFAGRSVTKAEAQSKEGASIFFHHALTGVKFRMGNELDLDDWNGNRVKTRTFITKVEFIGLKDSGTCTVTPTKENDGYTNQEGIYSSASAVAWNGLSSSNETISQSFGDDDIVDYGTDTPAYEFPESFYDYNKNVGDKDGLDKNLNDTEASMTFWLIPQTLDENVKIKVYVKVVNGEDVNNGPDGEGTICVLDLGSKLAGKSWKAGELRTFTIKPDVVGIKIDDEMTNGNTVKEKVVIKNLGNVKEYVRVNIIGNWVGEVQTSPNVYAGPSVLMGYPNAEKDGDGNYTNHTLIPTWNDKDFVWNGSTKQYTTPGYPTTGYGTFVGLPEKGTDSAPGAAVGKWIRHDKYYYYMEPIGPGDSINPTTEPLFEKYTIGPSPAFWIADGTGERLLARNVHLEMDVMVQAIRVPVNGNGQDIDYETAWKQELGVSNLNEL